VQKIPAAMSKVRGRYLTASGSIDPAAAIKAKPARTPTNAIKPRPNAQPANAGLSPSNGRKYGSVMKAANVKTDIVADSISGPPVPRSIARKNSTNVVSNPNLAGAASLFAFAR